MTSDKTRTSELASHGMGTQAIGRTLSVLDLFRQRAHDLGILEIADELSLSTTTAHRIVRALASAGYLAQDEATERYYLGRAAILLGQAASERLGLDRAQNSLDRVRDETGESVNLGTRDGDDIIVVIRAESRHPLRFSQQPGSRLPAHATSMGKATLANTPAPIAHTVAALGKPLRRLTDNTITVPARLRKELELTKARGYSVDDEEAIAGVRCVGAPILSDGDAGYPYAAVALQAPAVRMPTRRIEELGHTVMQLAKDLAGLLPASYPL